MICFWRISVLILSLGLGSVGGIFGLFCLVFHIFLW